MTKPLCVYGIKNKADFERACKYLGVTKYISGEKIGKNDYNDDFPSRFRLFDMGNGLSDWDLGKSTELGLFRGYSYVSVSSISLPLGGQTQFNIVQKELKKLSDIEKRLDK